MGAGNTVLTDAERAFACEHHHLIYGFLSRHKLPEDDYYGAAALGYLHAVHRYLGETKLQRFSFSTIAYRAMAQSVSQYRNSLQRQTGPGNVLSLDTGGHGGQSLVCPASAIERAAYRELEETLLLHALVKELSPRQQAVVRLRLQGYGIHEVARLHTHLPYRSSQGVLPLPSALAEGTLERLPRLHVLLSHVVVPEPLL